VRGHDGTRLVEPIVLGLTGRASGDHAVPRQHFAGNAKQSFGDKCIPKLELGNERGRLELGNEHKDAPEVLADRAARMVCAG